MLETWLLLKGSVGEGGDEVLRRLDASLALPRRFVASLGVSAGRPTLAFRSSDEAGKFFTDLRENEKVDALSLAPAAQLSQMNGRLFQDQAYSARLTWPLPDAEREGAGMLALRFVRFERTPTAALSAAGADTCVTHTGGARLPLLFPDPHRLKFTEDKSSLFSSMGAYFADTGLAIPPPTRAAFPDGHYFHSDRIRLRKAIREALGLALPSSGEPAVVTLWRLLDHPLVRDLALDGAYLRVVGERGEQTRVRITLPKSSDPVAEYRAALVSDATSVPVQWSGPLGAALRADLMTLSSGMELDIGTGTPVNWKQSLLRARIPNSRATTSDLLRRVGRALPTARDVGSFGRLVLDQHVDSDSDLEARRFVQGAARCPWSSETGTGPWRRALLGALSASFSAAEIGWVQSLADDLPSEGRHDAAEHVYKFTSGARADLARIKLLLPIGTRLQWGGVAMLDEPLLTLDGQWLLAGRETGGI